MEAVIIIFIIGSVNALCQEICNGLSWKVKEKAGEIFGWAFVVFFVIGTVAAVSATAYNIINS